MIRYTFNTTSACIRSLYFTSSRAFTAGPSLSSKACVDKILEPAQSTGHKVYKTVKEKDYDDKTVRRNQLIWLVKHSFGEEIVGAKVSPHQLSWFTDVVGKQDKREGSQVDVTVWPHLW